MRTRKVNRYYCDFCKKSGCSSGHIKHHEERCTLNPNRVCEFCKMLVKEQPNIKQIIDDLPPKEEYFKSHYYQGEESYNEAYLNERVLPFIRERTEHCPACTMAVIRQAGIPAPAVSDFNFQEEQESIWQDINKDRLGCR